MNFTSSNKKDQNYLISYSIIERCIRSCIFSKPYDNRQLCACCYLSISRDGKSPVGICDDNLHTVVIVGEKFRRVS